MLRHLPFKRVKLAHRRARGPVRDGTGALVPVFWVECAGCGHQHPMEVGEDGHHRVPDELVPIHGVDRRGDRCTPTFYASPRCIRQAHQRIVKTHDEAWRAVSARPPLPTGGPIKPPVGTHPK